jgi:hypothetical protein
MSKKKSKTGIIIIIIICIVIGIIVWGFLTQWKFFKNKAEEDQQQVQNILKKIQKKEKAEKVENMPPEKEMKLNKEARESLDKLKDKSVLQEFIQKAKEESQKEFTTKKGDGYKSIEHMEEVGNEMDKDPDEMVGGFRKENIITVLTKSLPILVLYSNMIQETTNTITLTPKFYMELYIWYKMVNKTRDEMQKVCPGSNPPMDMICKSFLPKQLGGVPKLLFQVVLPTFVPQAGQLKAWGLRYSFLSDSEKEVVPWSTVPESLEVRIFYDLLTAILTCPMFESSPTKSSDDPFCQDCYEMDTPSSNDQCFTDCPAPPTKSSNDPFCQNCYEMDTATERCEIQCPAPSSCTMQCLQDEAICPASEANGLLMGKKCGCTADTLPDYVPNYVNYWCNDSTTAPYDPLEGLNFGGDVPFTENSATTTTPTPPTSCVPNDGPLTDSYGYTCQDYADKKGTQGWCGWTGDNNAGGSFNSCDCCACADHSECLKMKKK